MADTESPKTVESTKVDEKKVEEKEKVCEKPVKVSEKPVKDDAKVEENGQKEDSKASKEEQKKSDDEPSTDKCSIKRKSSGDAVDGKVEETTPEKKAKVDTAPADTEANGEVTEAEAAA